MVDEFKVGIVQELRTEVLQFCRGEKYGGGGLLLRPPLLPLLLYLLLLMLMLLSPHHHHDANGDQIATNDT